MKFTAVLFFSLALPLLAAPPQKPERSRYAPLWINSPFTAKPIANIPSGPPPVNPMDDYALGGVTQLPDGYFVILINKKNPQETKIIQPGVYSPFKVLSVNMGVDKISADGTLVKEGASIQLASGSMQGEVKYDDKIMAIKPAPNVAPPAQNYINPAMNNRPIVPPATNNAVQSNNSIRQPRLRTLAPPVIPQPQTSAPQIPQNQQGQNIQNILPVQ